MVRSSLPIPERARKNEKVILSSMASAGQVGVAVAMGVSESYISKLKNGDIEHLSKFLAACGLKVVPVDFVCSSEEELNALRLLASKSELLRPVSELSWDD